MEGRGTDRRVTGNGKRPHLTSQKKGRGLFSRTWITKEFLKLQREARVKISSRNSGEKGTSRPVEGEIITGSLNRSAKKRASLIEERGGRGGADLHRPGGVSFRN